MTRLRQFPLLLLALLALFVLTPLSVANAESEVVTANQKLCITCRDGGDCSKAYFGLAGKFCYDYAETAAATDKTACCCGSAFVCGVSNATTTECNCDYMSTTTKKPSSTTAAPASGAATVAPKKETKGTSPWVWVGVGVAALMIIIIVGVGYVYCMRYQTKRAMGMMQEAHVQNAMTTAQQQQLQTIYMQHGGGQQQGGRYNNGNASL